MNQVNLAEHLRANAQHHPHKAALIYEGRPISYSELDRQTDRVATGLHKLGITKGDRVCFVVGNRPAFAWIHFGILRAGAVSVPLSTRLTAHEIRPYLARVNPRAIVMDEDAAPEVISAGPHRAPLFVNGKHPAARPLDDILGDNPPSSVDIGPDDFAVIAYTSGTSENAKAAGLSHGNIAASLDQMTKVPGANIEPNDSVYGVIPLYYLYALNVVLGMTIRRGATVVLDDHFDPMNSLRTIVDRDVTVIAAIPPMYEAWLAIGDSERFDLSKVRLAVSGGSALSPLTLEGFRTKFGVEIWEGYGLTETASVVTTTKMAKQRPGSVGMPLPGQKVRIVDESGADVILGDPGEVWVRGPNVFRGYWGDEAATVAAFSDDWFRTGDLAYQDEDGYLWLVDRSEEVIEISGFKVYPHEVERVLVTHDAVADAAVVAEPDPRQGRRVKGIVVLEPGQTAGEDELIVHCTRHLARFKVPSVIEFVEELPRLESGAVLRRALGPKN
jgi:long-chain acyl-CoA synthetase